MTHDDIERIIAAHNAGGRALHFLRAGPVAEDVEYGWVWEPHLSRLSRCDFHEMYFLTFAGRTVGAVNVLKNDVHTHMLKEYRGRGIFEHLFRCEILPHLFRDGRARQCISFEQPKLARHFERMGFRVAWNMSEARFDGCILREDVLPPSHPWAHGGPDAAAEKAMRLLSARDEAGMTLFLELRRIPQLRGICPETPEQQSGGKNSDAGFT